MSNLLLVPDLDWKNFFLFIFLPPPLLLTGITIFWITILFFLLRMKTFLFLLLLPVVLAQECCMPLQYEGFIGMYFGYVLRNEPDFEPQTVNGVNRLISYLFRFIIVCIRSFVLVFFLSFCDVLFNCPTNSLFFLPDLIERKQNKTYEWAIMENWNDKGF